MAERRSSATGKSPGDDDESRSERINREVIELINELRVALVGVQVLFAFLLAVPFAQGFADVTSFQKTLFFGVLCSTAIASALLVAPSAYHRINFRAKDKEQMLRTSNGLMIGGLASSRLSIIGAVVLDRRLHLQLDDDDRLRRRSASCSSPACGSSCRCCGGTRSRRRTEFRTGEQRTSGCPDLNRGPPAPKAGALPGCATPRGRESRPHRLNRSLRPRGGRDRLSSLRRLTAVAGSREDNSRTRRY